MVQPASTAGGQVRVALPANERIHSAKAASSTIAVTVSQAMIRTYAMTPAPER